MNRLNKVLGRSPKIAHDEVFISADIAFLPNINETKFRDYFEDIVLLVNVFHFW